MFLDDRDLIDPQQNQESFINANQKDKRRPSGPMHRSMPLDKKKEKKRKKKLKQKQHPR